MFIVNLRKLICPKKNEIIKGVGVEGIRTRKKSGKSSVKTEGESGVVHK